MSYEDVKSNYTSTTQPASTESPKLDNEIKFFVIPLVVIIIIMLFSAFIYLMAQRRRQAILRENILSLYEFDKNEEWDSFNSLDNPSYHSISRSTAF